MDYRIKITFSEKVGDIIYEYLRQFSDDGIFEYATTSYKNIDVYLRCANCTPTKYGKIIYALHQNDCVIEYEMIRV